MKKYRCKHAVEAACWEDTDENRERFAAWFEEHDAMFSTLAEVVILPEGDTASPGDWIVYSDGEFLVMTDENFRDCYEEAES